MEGCKRSTGGVVGALGGGTGGRGELDDLNRSGSVKG
jgi:hypothetical protein